MNFVDINKLLSSKVCSGAYPTHIVMHRNHYNQISEELSKLVGHIANPKTLLGLEIIISDEDKYLKEAMLLEVRSD